MQSMLLGMFDWIGDFFKSMFDLIPKIIYLLYASLACLIDVLQLFFRKLAGLDVFYVDGEAIAGDLVTNFITGILGINENGFRYSALSTVFWSMVLFGVNICFISVFISIIKSHYSYNEESAKGPMPIVYTGIKALVNIAAVPIIVVLGLYLSQAILTALDSMTSITSGNILEMYGKDACDEYLMKSKTARGSANNANILGLQGETTYIYYDIFGYASAVIYGAEYFDGFEKNDGALVTIASTQQSFSGSVFKVAAYNANRARLGQLIVKQGADPDYRQIFTGGADSELPLFKRANEVADGQTLLADMIDTAFCCNLHLKKSYTLRYDYVNGSWVSFRYFTNFLAKNVAAFSKFNIGLVWYYYDLWQFNFMVGFGAIVVCTTIFINIILGLITRLFMCIGLFLVAPPLFGLTPLDKGEAAKKWRENFMKQVLMAYGAVVGMNIFLLILPYMNEIKFFNIGIADYLAQTLIIIVGLITIKAFISTISGLIGAEDANKAGDSIKGEVGQTLGKAAALTGGAAKLGVKALGGVAKVGANAIGGAARGIDKLSGNRISGGLKKAGGAIAGTAKKVGGKIAGTKVGRGAVFVGKGAAKVGKGIGKGFVKVKDVLTGKDKEKAAQAEARAAANRQKEMDDFKKKNDFLKSVVGQGYSADEIEDMAVEQGFDNRTVDNLKIASRQSTLSGAQASLSTNDASFLGGMNSGWNKAKKFRAEKSARDAAVASANTNVERASKRTLKIASPKKLAESGLGQIGGVFGWDDEKSFLGSFGKASKLKKSQTDYAKLQYQEMQDMNKGLGGMREDMNSGFSDVQQGLSSGFSGTQRTIVSQGEAVVNKLDQSTQQLQAQNDQIRKTVNRIDRKENDNKKAREENKRLTENMNKKINEIRRNTKK